MMEIFYEHPGENEWKSGILLQEYNGTFELVRANKSRNSEGTVFMRWGFPQNKDKQAMEKAIPWKLELGNAREAVSALKFFLRQLTGDNAEPTQDDLGYAADGTPIPF